jgi:hypothetical protein
VEEVSGSPIVALRGPSGEFRGRVTVDRASEPQPDAANDYLPFWGTEYSHAALSITECESSTELAPSWQEEAVRGSAFSS